MQQPTITVQLPTRFYDDHVSRELPSGTEIKRTKKLVTVELDREAYDDLLSDARYYTDPSTVGQLGPEYLGLVASARATAKRLEAAAPQLAQAQLDAAMSDAYFQADDEELVTFRREDDVRDAYVATHVRTKLTARIELIDRTFWRVRMGPNALVVSSGTLAEAQRAAVAALDDAVRAHDRKVAEDKGHLQELSSACAMADLSDWDEQDDALNHVALVELECNRACVDAKAMLAILEKYEVTPSLRTIDRAAG